GEPSTFLNRGKSSGVMPDRKQAASSNRTNGSRKKCCGNARKRTRAEQTRAPGCTESRAEEECDGEPSRRHGAYVEILRWHEPIESSSGNERSAQQSGP